MADENDCIMPIAEWLSDCDQGMFIDYDGYGYLRYGDREVREAFYPSQRKKLPEGVTHINWFNR